MAQHLRIARPSSFAPVLFAVVALAPARPSRNDSSAVLDLYWNLFEAAAYAVSYFARGYLADNASSALWRAVLRRRAAAPFRSQRLRSGSREGQSASRSDGGAPTCRCPGCRRRWHAGWRPARTLRQTPTLRCSRRRTREPAARSPSSRSPRAASRRPSADLLCEQTSQCRPAAVKATEGLGAALAGFTFNVLHRPRAAHLSGGQTRPPPPNTARASGESDPFRRSVNLTLMAIAVSPAAWPRVLAAGPGSWTFSSSRLRYERGGLVSGRRMGLYLSPQRDQRLLAHASRRSVGLLGQCPAGFVRFLLLADFDDRCFSGAASCRGGLAELSAVRAVPALLTYPPRMPRST